MKGGRAERLTHLVGQVCDADTFRHCSCEMLVGGDQGRVLVMESKSCLSLFISRTVMTPQARGQLRAGNQRHITFVLGG